MTTHHDDDQTDGPDPAPAEMLGYAAALAELETILTELEDDDLDVDILAGRVDRAAHLIRHCRGRIRTAEMRVEEIVADLDPGDGDGDGDGAPTVPHEGPDGVDARGEGGGPSLPLGS